MNKADLEEIKKVSNSFNYGIEIKEDLFEESITEQLKLFSINLLENYSANFNCCFVEGTDNFKNQINHLVENYQEEDKIKFCEKMNGVFTKLFTEKFHCDENKAKKLATKYTEIFEESISSMSLVLKE